MSRDVTHYLLKMNLANDNAAGRQVSNTQSAYEKVPREYFDVKGNFMTYTEMATNINNILTCKRHNNVIHCH